MITLNLEESLFDQVIDGIVISAMRDIIMNHKAAKYHLEEDKEYYERLSEAAEVVMDYYTVPGEKDD